MRDAGRQPGLICAIRALTASITSRVFTPVRATMTPPTASSVPLTSDATRKAFPDVDRGDLLDVHRHAGRRADDDVLEVLGDSIRPTPRTIDHAPFASSTLPPTLRLLSRTAATTALSGMP